MWKMSTNESHDLWKIGINFFKCFIGIIENYYTFSFGIIRKIKTRPSKSGKGLDSRMLKSRGNRREESSRIRVTVWCRFVNDVNRENYAGGQSIIIRSKWGTRNKLRHDFEYRNAWFTTRHVDSRQPTLSYLYLIESCKIIRNLFFKMVSYDWGGE